jgi:hypothetical protein
MRHVEKALHKMADQIKTMGIGGFIVIENIADVKGVAPTVKFTIQSDPISEVGVNGCQATDMLLYIKCLFESLNEAFPCHENTVTIQKLTEALDWQEQRTNNRIKRGVEGKNQA